MESAMHVDGEISASFACWANIVNLCAYYVACWLLQKPTSNILRQSQLPRRTDISATLLQKPKNS